MTETPKIDFSKRLLDYTGQVVLVTGGRSGIGAATATAFAQQGAKVIIAGRTHATETLDKIKQLGGDAIFIQCDVSNDDDVQKLMGAIVDQYGQLDVAFNNAGVGTSFAELVDLTEDDFHHIFETDVKGVFLCMKYEIPIMLKQPTGGAIINCGSVVSEHADPGMALYVGAKHAVAGLTRAASIEYINRNIRINMLAPGFTATEMTSDWIADPEFLEIVKGFNFAHRWAEPEEMAGIVLFLGSPMASFMAGSLIAVDAGQAAH